MASMRLGALVFHGIVGAVVSVAACASFGSNDTTTSADASADAVAVPPEPPPPPPAADAGLPLDGLIAHWPFDDGSGSTARETVANQFATLHGGATWTKRDGGVALLLPGGNVDDGGIGAGGYAHVDDALALHGYVATNAFTVALWLDITDTTPTDPRVFRFSDSFDIKLNAMYPQLATSNAFWRSSAMLPGGWRHLAVTYAMGKVAIYVDGMRDPAPVVSGTQPMIAAPTGGLFIGSYDDQSYFLRGEIAEVAFWARALRDDEITAIARR